MEEGVFYRLEGSYSARSLSSKFEKEYEKNCNTTMDCSYTSFDDEVCNCYRFDCKVAEDDSGRFRISALGLIVLVAVVGTCLFCLYSKLRRNEKNGSDNNDNNNCNETAVSKKAVVEPTILLVAQVPNIDKETIPDMTEDPTDREGKQPRHNSLQSVSTMSSNY